METQLPILGEFWGAEYENDIKICRLALVFKLQTSVTPLDKSSQHCTKVAPQSYHVIRHCNRLVLHYVISSYRLEHVFSCYVVFSELGQVVVICSRSEFFEITVFCVSSFLSCNIKTLKCRANV
jgi:hypothetical protein